MNNSLKDRTVTSFGWKFAQSTCTLGASFIIQIILARILAPSDFGIVAITTVFMTIANTIIETSFSSSVIQKSELSKEQLSSIFFANLVLSILVYCFLFFLAPLVSMYYDQKILTPILRVQGIRVVFSALYSIQLALLNRNMEFKKTFFCFLTGAIIQGISGIIMAKLGYGVWALVLSTIINYFVSGFLIVCVSKWIPKLYFSLKLVKDALKFSSKVLFVNVVEKIFANIRSLAMGKVYGSDILGLFNKGFQFPSTIMTVVDGSLITVSFTSLSKLQDDINKLRDAMRLFIKIITYLTTPILVGMILVAKPMICFLLTEKWIGCIPFLQLVCIAQLMKPLLVKSQAFNAIGRSDISMKLNVSGVVFSIILILLTARFSPFVMVFSDIIACLTLHIATGIVSKKYFLYSYRSQLEDFFTPLIPTIAMGISVYAVSRITMPYFVALFVEILVGIFVYIGVSIITRNSTFLLLLEIAKSKLIHTNKD